MGGTFKRIIKNDYEIGKVCIFNGFYYYYEGGKNKSEHSTTVEVIPYSEDMKVTFKEIAKRVEKRMNKLVEQGNNFLRGIDVDGKKVELGKTGLEDLEDISKFTAENLILKLGDAKDIKLSNRYIQEREMKEKDNIMGGSGFKIKN